MSVREATFLGFGNPVDPRPDELQTWAYNPESVPLSTMPKDWDLLISGDVLGPTLFELAMDRQCPARRFAQHCMYIYAADGLRQNASGQRKRDRPATPGTEKKKKERQKGRYAPDAFCL